MPDQDPYASPATLNDESPATEVSRARLSKRYWIVLTILLFLSVGPTLALRIYIKLTGDFEARWLVIRFMAEQLLVWSLFLVAILVGLGKAWNNRTPG